MFPISDVTQIKAGVSPLVGALTEHRKVAFPFALYFMSCELYVKNVSLFKFCQIPL